MWLVKLRCCTVIVWIFCGIEILTGEVIQLLDGRLPLRDGVVIASLLPILPTEPTLPMLPDGEGVGDIGEGVPVVLNNEKGKKLLSSFSSCAWFQQLYLFCSGDFFIYQIFVSSHKKEKINREWCSWGIRINVWKKNPNWSYLEFSSLTWLFWVLQLFTFWSKKNMWLC